LAKGLTEKNKIQMDVMISGNKKGRTEKKGVEKVKVYRHNHYV